MSKPSSSGQDLIREQQAINEHHRHGCCNQRYHCDGARCPTGLLLNPAIGIPLAICTGGLSAAASGMYKGVRDHRRRTELKKAHEELNQEERADSGESSSSTRTSEDDVPRSFLSPAVEKDGTPATSWPSMAVEKMDDSMLEEHVPYSTVSATVETGTTPARSHRFTAVEKIHDSLPAELENPDTRGVPPKYAELDGS